MINPEKLKRTVGNKKLKIGVSVGELALLSLLPSLLSWAGLDPFIALSSLFLGIGLLSLSRKFLGPKYFYFFFKRQDVIKLKDRSYE